MAPNRRMVLKGNVVEINLKVTRKRQQMAIIKVLSRWRMFEVIVWPDVWAIHRNRLKSGKLLTLNLVVFPFSDDEGKKEGFTLLTVG